MLVSQCHQSTPSSGTHPSPGAPCLAKPSPSTEHFSLPPCSQLQSRLCFTWAYTASCRYIRNRQPSTSPATNCHGLTQANQPLTVNNKCDQTQESLELCQEVTGVPAELGSAGNQSPIFAACAVQVLSSPGLISLKLSLTLAHLEKSLETERRSGAWVGNLENWVPRPIHKAGALRFRRQTQSSPSILGMLDLNPPLSHCHGYLKQFLWC